MKEITQIVSIDLLNSLTIYLLTSSLVFLLTYLKSNGDFKTTVRSTLIYILLSPILIPSVKFLFDSSLDLLSNYGVDKFKISNFLLLEHWNISTVSEIYFKFIILCSILLFIFIPFRFFAGDTLKDILYLISFLFDICTPAMVIIFYFSVLLYKIIESCIFIPYKAIYLTSTPLVAWLVIAFITIFILFMFIHFKNKYLR